MNTVFIIFLSQVVFFLIPYFIVKLSIRNMQIDMNNSMWSAFKLYTLAWALMLFASTITVNVIVITEPKKIAGYLAVTATLLFLLFFNKTIKEIEEKASS